MSPSTRAWTALGTLAAILAITASWWALALWPVETTAPEWLLQTRAVCFGATADGLPNAGGWLLLIGEPIGMIVLLAALWGTDLRAGIALATARMTGQVAVGILMALAVAGLGSVVMRVRAADARSFSPDPEREMATRLTRLNDPAPDIALIDQAGQQVTLEAFRGRPVLVTFVFAHCQTVCPLLISDVLQAQRRLSDNPPVVLVVTLDPWRDTPSRLAAIAEQWGVGRDGHVLSGAPEAVERTLNAWRVPRARNEKTGDLSHPSIVYVIGPDGRIAYAVNGNPDAISAAVRSL